MADRFPLILNTNTNQIQEIPSGDNLDLTGTGISNAGIITAGNVTIGAATTDLIVSGDARITGILTIGTSSLKLDGPNNLVNVGTALTLGHTQGLQFHTQNLHSAGFEVNQINVSGASTMGGDVTFTGDNYNVLWDKSQNQLEFADNAKALFGTDGDLFVFHNGSNSYVQDAGQGILFLDCSETNITKYGSNHNMAKFIGGGAVELYHNNTKRFETTTSGVTVTGDGTFTGNVSIGGTLTYEDVTNIDSVGIVTAREGIFIPDNKELKIGNTAASSDLRIYSNGSSSFADSYGGNFSIRVSDQSGGVENKLVARPNAQIELYYNDAKKLETRSNGITVTGYTYSDGVTIGDGTAYKYLAGSGNQLQMYHTGGGGNGYINNSQGTLMIGGPVVSFTNQANNAFLIRAVDGGTAELYHANNKKIHTRSLGASVTGGLHINTDSAITGTPLNYLYGYNGSTSKNGLTIEGAETGLELIGTAGGDHSSSILLRNLYDGFAFINDNDANQLELKYFTAVSDNFNVHGVGNGLTKLETSAIFKEDGAVELYNNNTKRLETAGHGAKVSGYLTMTAPVGFCAYRRDTGTDDEYPMMDSSNAAINGGYFGQSSLQTPRGQLTTNTQYDNNGVGGSCYSHDGTKFTAPIAGVYTLTFNLSLYVRNDNGGDNSVGWGFFKNQSKINWGTYDSGLSVTQSTPYVFGQDCTTNLSNAFEIGAPHLTIITTLAAGDEIQVGWDNMSKILGVRSFIFSGHLLG